ncbi:hypothetical protein DVH05_005820 [Phytophthora capsici]|nr:hypothetical protein DVH05_005820 [Phytophthora capsici]
MQLHERGSLETRVASWWSFDDGDDGTPQGGTFSSSSYSQRCPWIDKRHLETQDNAANAKGVGCRCSSTKVSSPPIESWKTLELGKACNAWDPKIIAAAAGVEHAHGASNATPGDSKAKHTDLALEEIV